MLWGAGCIVSGAIIILWNRSEKPGRISAFDNLETTTKSRNTADNIVNELLLSANELNIYGKSSLIEYNRDNSLIAGQLLEQIKTDPGKAYQAILNNKLDKLKQKQVPVPDFSVRPVPK